MRIGSTALILSLLAPLTAQSVTVPAANADVRGSSGSTALTANAGQPHTYMLGIDAVHLTSIPIGSVINGISFRAAVLSSSPALWPPGPNAWDDYEVFVGSALPAASMTATFASNFTSPPLQVHDGPLVVKQGTYRNNVLLSPPAPNAWGEFYFDFGATFRYQGGNLAFLFSHPGSLAGTTIPLDSVPTAPGSGRVAFGANSFGATVGSPENLLISRVHFGYGIGCGGVTGVPNLVQNENTTGGGTILLTIVNGPPNTYCAWALGLLPGTSILRDPCPLLVQQPIDITFGVTDNYGRATKTVEVPTRITGTFNAQGGVFDSTGPVGFTVTNGVTPRAF